MKGTGACSLELSAAEASQPFCACHGAALMTFLRSETLVTSGGCGLLVQLRYANNSNYKNDTMIRKEAFVASPVLDELRRIIEDSEVGSTSCSAVCCVTDQHTMLSSTPITSRVSIFGLV